MRKKILTILICMLVAIGSFFTVATSTDMENQISITQINISNQVGNTLITEIYNNRVIEVNSSGTIVWQKTDLCFPVDAERLENGNTLITELGNNSVIEIDTGGAIVWDYTAGLYGPWDAERLSNGNTLITDSYNYRVIEVDSSGMIVWEKDNLYMPVDAERLANGNTLIVDLGNDSVIEVDSNGTIVWEKDNLSMPVDAERLENGNTLITQFSYYYGAPVIEVDSNGNIIWEYYSSAILFDSERLSNGNTLITEYYFGDSVIEVDSNGTIVWEKTGLVTPVDAERISISSEPPNIPATPSGPIWLNLNAEGTYNTSASDPDGDEVQYRFDWDANGSHDYSGWTDFVPSGTQANLSHSWDVGGTYVVKAQARDEYYESSGWSNGLSVFVNCPPNTPGDPEPEDGATDVDIEVDLSWSCSDPDGDDLTYDVYFEADDSTPDVLVSNNQSETWYDPGTMEYSTHYYWQIVAWDEYGLYIEGLVWDFVTSSGPNDPPNSPSNPLPEDGATGVDIKADLSWDCDDPDGDSLTYDVYFDTVDPPVDKVSDDQVETTFDPGTLDFGTTYYWQIIAKDVHSASTDGPVWQFTTRDNNPPDAPTIDGELSGKVGKEYEYTFNAVDSDGDDVKYFIVWGDNSTEWTGFNPSGIDVKIKHNWSEKGDYKIISKAQDMYGAEGQEGTLAVTMPKNKPMNFNFNMLEWFFGRFPNAFPILRYILGL
jgi:hypothetical protein